MERKRHREADVTAEREAPNQKTQRTEMGRRRHGQADVTAESESPKQETQRTEMGRKRPRQADLTTEREAPNQKAQRTEVGQGSGASGYGDGDGAAGTLVPQSRKLEVALFRTRKTMAAWDYENAEIPADLLDHNLVHDLFIKKLSEVGFSGPIEFYVTVGYWDSIQPKWDGIPVNYANQCVRPTDRVTSRNQAADVDMTRWTKKWLATHAEPQNVLFISGDTGFSKSIDLLTRAGHLVFHVTMNKRAKDPRVYMQWTLREFLSLPADRVYKNPSEKREADRKREKRRAQQKNLHKSRKDAKVEELENAKTDPIPKSIVQLDDGSVQISIAIQNHKQKPAITSIDDECVSVYGVDDMGSNQEILEEIARRIGKSQRLMEFKKVGDSNMWNLVVKDMTDRQTGVFEACSSPKVEATAIATSGHFDFRPKQMYKLVVNLDMFFGET